MAGTAENIGMLKDTVKKSPEKNYKDHEQFVFVTCDVENLRGRKENYSQSADVLGKPFKTEHNETFCRCERR